MKNFLPALLILLFPPLAHADDPQDLLEPDQAFALTLKARDANTIEASWKIAPGYYLYRDKFKFESLDPAVTLKPAALPSGKVKNDPNFGRIETYSHDIVVRLPFERSGQTQRAKLRITAQGCNEPVGVCYPPIVKDVEVELPPPGATPTVSLNTLKDLVSLTGSRNTEPDFLPPDEAFALTTEMSGPNTVTANVRIAPGYYLYRDKTSVRLVHGDGVKLGKAEITRGEVKNDPTFGKVEVIHNELVVTVPVERAKPKATVIDLEVSYQGCAEKGICYPPLKKTVSLNLPAAGEPVAVMTTTATTAPTVRGDSYWNYILAAFGAGLLLTFTPCVLPMIPILSGVIVRSGDQTLSKMHGGLLSYSYVLGTAVTYAAAGALAGATGEQLQSYFQNPLAIGTFATVLLLLALSMFGLYELQMPGFIQSKLHYHSHKIKGGSFVGAFVLGLVSALIVGACVSPVLISVLAVALANKDPWLGGGILFALAHGQGVILVAVGIGAGFLLPRAGAWMDRVKNVFGVMLIAVAISLLGYLPQVPVLLLWAVLLIVTSVYMGATQTLPHDVSGWRYLWKGMGTFLLIWGALALLGGLMGERDVLRPVPLRNLTTLAAGTTATAASAPADQTFQRYGRLADIDAALARAKSAGRPVLIDFYASWCTDCVRMEKTTFVDARVREAFQRFTLVQADVTNNDAASSAIKQRFGVFGPPAMLILGADGTEQKELRVYGFRTVDELLALLGRV